MKNRSITLVVLTVLAIFAGGIEQTQAQNHWTNAGASPGGGFIIIGNDPGTDLSYLSQSSSPVFLSSNGYNIITEFAGNTATGVDFTMELEENHDTFTNYGTLTATGDYALYTTGSSLLINNHGTITADYLPVYVAGGSNITLNNWGAITETGAGESYAVYSVASYFTLNNYSGATISAPYSTVYNSGDHFTLNNAGAITASVDYAVYNNSGNNFTLNNYRGGTISSTYDTVYNDGANSTVNNWGAITAGTGDYAVGNDASNFTLNNWGMLSAAIDTVYEDGAFNTLNNWGMIAGATDEAVYSDGSNFLLNNWGAISSSGAVGVYIEDSHHDTINNYGTGSISGASAGVEIYHSSRNTINNWAYISSSAGDGIYIDQSSRNIINNWGSISGAVNGVDIASASRNILNLDGHSSVNGKITISNSHNTVNLNFTGMSPVTINSLNASLGAKGANTGKEISVMFTLRGVTYNIDPAMIYTHFSSYQLQGVTPNQAAIGASLDSATVNPAPGSPLFNLFNTIDASGNVPAALEAFSPQQYEAFGDLAIANASAWVLEIDERLNNIRNGSESIDTSGIGGDTVAALVTGNSKDEGGKEMKESKAVETTPVPNRWGFFASGNGLFFRGNPHDADFQDAKANTVGTLAGVDAKVGDHAVAGVLFAYENSPVDLGNGGNATIESYAGGVYGGWHDNGIYVNGLAAYTRNNYTSTRTIAFPGFAAASNGSTNGNQATANIDGGYDWNVTDRLAVGPIAGLQYVHLDINGFDEAGAGAAGLTIGDQDMDSLQSRLGLHAEYRLLTTAVSSFAAEAHAAWQHEYLNDSRAITASFEGSGLTPFAVQTASPLRDAAVVGADVNYTVHNRLTLFAGYDLQIWNSSYFEQTVNAGLRITW